MAEVVEPDALEAGIRKCLGKPPAEGAVVDVLGDLVAEDEIRVGRKVAPLRESVQRPDDGIRHGDATDLAALWIPKNPVDVVVSNVDEPLTKVDITPLKGAKFPHPQTGEGCDDVDHRVLL